MYCACGTVYCAFDVLYLMTHMSSGDGKGVIFSVLIALSCSVNTPVQEEVFSRRFCFIGKPYTLKIEKPPWSHLIIANIHWHYV